MKSLVFLTRDQFNERVFSRDGHKCVFCELPAVNVHHIMEKKLFSDGGYYIENGASVCSQHHLECEMTLISPDEVREACGITRVVLPEHYLTTDRYDKWGNQILASGMRLRGELFLEEQVQKVLKLAGFIKNFTWQVKQPRLLHLPWSPGYTSDDKVLKSIDHFFGKEVVISIKMDGENTSIYSDYFHARSLDSRHHPSRDWVKAFWGSIRHDIPEGWRIVGENVYAEHSIRYEDLDSYFYGFNLWNERNVCLSWDETLEYFEMLGIKPVREVWRGIFDEAKVRDICASLNLNKDEGIVIRLAGEFAYKDFTKSVAKFVRKGHVQTDEHWMNGEVIANKIK